MSSTLRLTHLVSSAGSIAQHEDKGKKWWKFYKERDRNWELHNMLKGWRALPKPASLGLKGLKPRQLVKRGWSRAAASEIPDVSGGRKVWYGASQSARYGASQSARYGASQAESRRRRSHPQSRCSNPYQFLYSSYIQWNGKKSSMFVTKQLFESTCF